MMFSVTNDLRQKTGGNIHIFSAIKLELPTKNFVVEDGSLQVDGVLVAQRLGVDALATMNVLGMARVVYNDFTNKGSTTIAGELWVTKPGKHILNRPSANFTVNAGADVVILDGNFVNESLLTFSPNTCNSINGGGNFENKSSGLVLGVGEVYAGGEIKNDGFWDPNVTWCAVQGASGSFPLPPPNCGTSCGPLPVTLNHFEAIAENGAVVIAWQSLTELNNRFFTLERSYDGTAFTPIAQISSTGNTDQITDYQHIDAAPGVGTVFYRLAQTDLNGNQTELGVATVELQAGANHFATWPNPFQGSFSIEWEGELAVENLRIQLTDLSGKVVFNQSESELSPGKKITLLPGNLEAGLYLLTLTQSDGVARQKMICN